MRKTLREMAGHLNNIILSDIPDAYEVKPLFLAISDEENIRKGAVAFRGFLYRLCEYLMIHGDLYDKPKKIAHPFSDRVSLPSNYPFLHYMEIALASIGMRGQLSQNAAILTVNGESFRADMAKIPTVKVVECLRCLTKNGFVVSGIDLMESKVNLAGIDALELSYPEDFSALIGIKVLALAKEEFEGTGLYGVLLRCDYRVIASEEPEPIYLLKDMTRMLPAENREFILNTHREYLGKGFQCAVNIVDETCIRFFYSYKRKEICSVIISANNGYELAIRAKHTDEYAETVKGFHPYLREKIRKGYGCDKKRDPGSYCQGGCKGFRISLSDSVRELDQDIVTWLDAEVSCLK